MRALLIIAIGSAIAALGSVAHAQDTANVPKRVIKMETFDINELANKNEPPAFVKTKRFLRPEYLGNYDFQEDRRIRSLFFNIVRSESADLWRTLVVHSNDERYALVVGDNGTDAEIWTIGRICRYVAKSRMMSLDRVNSDLNSVDRPDIYIGPTEPIGDLKDWWEANGKQNLREVQLQQCKDNLTRLLTHQEIPKAVKEHYQKIVSDEIAEISRSGKPIFHHLSWDRFDFFIPKLESKPEEVRTK